MPENLTLSSPQEYLKKHFGYNELRPLQEKIIDHVLDKNDCLVLMPTGGGKSICYQLPALMLDGICLVISPLISLMHDQVAALKQNGIAAAYLNSSLTSTASNAIEKELSSGQLTLLYVSPEKLLSQGFFQLLKTINISLIAIDEAHCISQWGHDFRPEYTQLSFLREQFTDTPIMALTATADKSTRSDILHQLNIPNTETFLASFDRPNLSLEVRPAQDRIGGILEFIKEQPNDSGIIYCLSRKSTESLAEKLQAHGLDAAHYHAGMPADERRRVQDNFVKDELNIVCATIAFGMGIDKSNVRWVIHYNLPKNLEGYYQEIGRAGRDGLPSKTLLFFSYRDVIQLQGFNVESPQQELLDAKLMRMQQYAEASTCRRTLLLSYFGEQTTENCGNCDVCQNPPEFTDGTILAQKALSACARTMEKVGINMLIDILRGSEKQELLQHNYHQIKTYGAGSAISLRDWQHYIGQFLNIGLLEIAYQDHNTLKITALGWQVLKGTYQAKVSKPTVVSKKEKTYTRDQPTKTQLRNQELFERLRVLRKRLADEQEVPAYVIFNDATLTELSAVQPTDENKLLEVSGVGPKKVEQYGSTFIGEIVSFLKEKSRSGDKIKGATHLITLDMLEEGLSVEAIAEKRSLNPVTIYSHIATLYEQDRFTTMEQYLSEDDKNKIITGIKETGESDQLKPLFEYFKEEIPYFKLRLAMAVYRKMKVDISKIRPQNSPSS